MRLATSHRRDLEAQLVALVPQLGADELRVLVLIARRVLAGEARYGRLDLSHDPRDLGREALEELLDAIFYLSAGLLSLGRPRRARRA